MQGAPDDLRKPCGQIGNKIIYFRREEEEAKNIQQNTDEIKKRAGKLDGGSVCTSTSSPSVAGSATPAGGGRSTQGPSTARVSDTRTERRPI